MVEEHSPMVDSPMVVWASGSVSLSTVLAATPQSSMVDREHVLDRISPVKRL